MDLKEVFPEFDQDLLATLEKIGTITEYAEGDMLMRTGQYFKNSMVVLDGTVKLYRDGEEGEEFFLYYLERGNACALSMICATKNEVSEIKAKAMTPVRALTIPIQHMDELMQKRNWYYFVLETYRNRFEELLQVIDQIAFHSMDEKLEFYLQRQFDTTGSDTITTTHQEIASDLNSSREVISRLLKKLEAQKRIRVSRNAITKINL